MSAEPHHDRAVPADPHPLPPHPRHPAGFHQESQESQPKGTRVSLFARRRDGSEFPVEINRGPLGPGPNPLVLVTIRDLTEWRTRRVNRLARALDEGGFHLYAQSIVPLLPEPATRPRCEILLRLPDERGNLQPAASFLPQAERYNLMPAIDRWVTNRTIELLGGWHRTHPECELPLCSINLSAPSLDDESLVPRLREQLSQHRLPPQALCFEIAEAAALANFAQTVRFISEIRTTGCGVALDDFGNGVLSFAYLKALAVDFLKIGGHYVRGVVDDPVYGTIVTAVNQVGRLMGITTIAEEVDSEPVLDRLRSLGIGYAQGRAVSVPEPLADSEGEVTFPWFQQLM